MREKIRCCIENEILLRTEASADSQRWAVNRLLDSTRRLHGDLAEQLETAVHLYAADSALAGFLLGWEFRQDPAVLLFDSEEECTPWAP